VVDKKAPVKLRTKVRELYTKWNKVERFTVPGFFDEVLRLYPDLCEAEKNRLFREAISGWVRKLIQEVPSRQMPMLPLALADEELPVRIPLRPAGKKSGPAVWTLFPDVTFAELDDHVEDFEKPRFNKRRLGLQRTRDFLASRMTGARRNQPIGPVLADVAQKESKSAAEKKKP
jgi:hypothetical protein